MLEGLLFVATEGAVRNLRQWGMDDVDARRLVRAEISFDTLMEIRRQLRDDTLVDIGAMIRREAPLTYIGVSYYLIEHLPVPWRVIAPAVRVGGRIVAKIVEGEDA